MSVEYGAITICVVNGEIEVLVDVNGTLYCEFVEEGNQYIQSLREDAVRQIEERLQDELDALALILDVPFNGDPLYPSIKDTVEGSDVSPMIQTDPHDVRDEEDPFACIADLTHDEILTMYNQGDNRFSDSETD